MKIRIFSDVHNEIRRYYMNRKVYTPWAPKPLPTDSETVLILAGDIESAKQLKAFVEPLAKTFKAVIVVAGNHEYYGSNMVSAKRHMQEVNLIPNAYFLDDQCITIDGQHFVGSTMWTNLTGREYPVMQAMNDYKRIRVGGGAGYRKLTAMDTTRFHARAYAFLANNITRDSIVITHHQPLSPGNMRMPNPYAPVETDVDYAYYACLQNEITEDWKPKLWIAGHTHTNHIVEDYFGTDLITNCVGYLGEEDYDERSLFEY